MKKTNPPDGVLVFDRYYGSKPITGLLIAERIIFCALLSAFSMLFIFTEYRMSVSLPFVGFVSALCAVFFSVLFIFVKRRIAIPILFLITVFVVYHNFEEIWLRFSYFVDEAMLLVEGRFLFPRGYLLHDEMYLTDTNRLYSEGMLLGTFLLCSLYALVCSASMKKRIRCIPALICFIILCIPRLLSETFELNVWLFPVFLLFAAAAAIGVVYKNGLAVVKVGVGAYRRQVRSDERVFLNNIKKAGLFKRIGMTFSYFSKYLTSGVYCAIIFAVALGIGLSAFGVGESMDYTPLYELVTGISEDVGTDSPFESGPVSDYFTSAHVRNRNEGLNITSPGNGEREIIQVTFSDNDPIYLRGDIGVVFTGDGWTTPVTNDRSWNNSGLAKSYRPCEVDVVRTLLSALSSEYTSIIDETDISIEYLCETDVVFLPAYTAEYSFYNNAGFDVYGDYVVRVNENSGDFIRSVQCKSLVYDFGDFSAYSSYETLSRVEELFAQNLVTVNDFYSTVVPEMASERDIIKHYSSYVNETYMQIPDDMREELLSFIGENIPSIIAATDGSKDELSSYWIAAAVSKFLSENYKYTLSGVNNGDSPVMEFLTETRRGHCSLYASAMTLMLRAMDIPARYCTGFSVYPTNETPSTVVLKEKNLHAWVEVYLGQFGWVTFDPTSGAMNAGQGNPVGNEDENNRTSETVDNTAVTEETKDTPAIPDKKDDNTDIPGSAEDSGENVSIPFENIVWIAVSCLAAASLILLMYKYISVKRRAEDVLKKSELLDGREIYAIIIEILYRCKLSPDAGQLPSEYYEAVDKQLNTELRNHSKTLEKAAFAASEISDDEVIELSDIFRSVYTIAIKRGWIFHKYGIRIIVLHSNKRK